MVRNFLVIGFILFAFLGISRCSKEAEEGLQNSLLKTKATDIVSLDTTNIPFDIKLKKEVIFESNEEVFLDGYLGDIAVDDKDRVYITATKPGKIGIYVFAPDGSFITEFGQEGRGPGEFESIGSIRIQGNELYVFGPRLQKYGVFSLVGYHLIRDQIIRRDSISKSDSLAKILKVNELLVTDTGEIIAKMSNRSMVKENEITKIFYQKLSENGNILPERILELKRFQAHFSERRIVPFVMPFARNSLVSMTGNGTFYAAWSEDFLINVYNLKGQHVRSFQFPYEKAPISISELDLHKSYLKILNEIDIPETWQALYTIENDDEKRLWVSTITKDDNVFQWWVVDEAGEVLAVFNRPRPQTEPQTVSVRPLYKIANGYFYEPERDKYGGVIRIVKYKIEFVKR